jgi:hypothetical protein
MLPTDSARRRGAPTPGAVSAGKQAVTPKHVGPARLDIDAKELIEQAKAAADKSQARLNAAVAVSVAVLATFMGICKVKNDNILQAMRQAQADKLDHWTYCFCCRSASRSRPPARACLRARCRNCR